jgi:hypothetical protein
VPVTTTTLPVTTTTLPPAPSVSLRVNNATHGGCGLNPTITVQLTICAVNGATGVNLGPDHFKLTQSNIDHDASTCTVILPDFCSWDITLNSPACYSCALVFELSDDGSPRTLTYESFDYRAQVTF